MSNSLESLLNADSEYKKYILKVLSQQNKENEPLSNTVLKSFKLESSKFLVFGRNSQHYSLKRDLKDKSENEFNKHKKRIHNSLTKHVYYTEKVKENLEKIKLEQIKSSAIKEKNENNATDNLMEIRKIDSMLFNNKSTQEDKNFISPKLYKKKEVFQVNNTMFRSNIKPRLKPILIDYYDSSIVSGNYTNAKNSSIFNSDNKLLKFNNFYTKENLEQEGSNDGKFGKPNIFNSDVKQSTNPIKILGKDKSPTSDFAKTKVKTLAEILKLEKSSNVNDDFFLQTYKEEDRNFMKKSNNHNSTNKGNLELISTKSGFDNSQNKGATNDNNSRNRAKSAKLLKTDNSARKIIKEQDHRVFESSKKINKYGANLILNQKNTLDFTIKKSSLSNHSIDNKNHKTYENRRHKKSISSAFEDSENLEKSYKNIISSTHLNGMNSTINFFNRRENFINESKKKFELFRKTCSLKNPFFDKNILLDNEKENEREKDVLNEFRNSGIQRDNLHKKSAQIDEQTNTIMHEITNFNSNKNLQLSDSIYAAEKRKINNLIRDLKGEVKNHQIDMSKIKPEDQKYFTFVKFQKSEEAEKIQAKHNCGEDMDNHEACCKFDNIKYEKEYEKTKEKFRNYTKTIYERKANQNLNKSNNKEDVHKIKKVLFKNSFTNFNKSHKNLGVYNSFEKKKTKASNENENLFSAEEDASDGNVHQSFKDINKFAKILNIKKVK